MVWSLNNNQRRSAQFMLYYRIVIVIFQTCSADEWIFHKFDNVLLVNSIYMQWNIMTALKKKH